MTYDELIVRISEYNGDANDLCIKLADTRRTLTPSEKDAKVREILSIWKKADELLMQLPEE